MLDNLKQCTSSCVVTKSVGGHNSPSHKLNSHGSNVFLPCLWQTGHQVIQTGRPGVRPRIVKLPTIHNWIYAPPPLIALGIWCREPYWYRTPGGWCQSGTRWMMSFRQQVDDVTPAPGGWCHSGTRWMMSRQPPSLSHCLDSSGSLHLGAQINFLFNPTLLHIEPMPCVVGSCAGPIHFQLPTSLYDVIGIMPMFSRCLHAQ